MHEWAREMRLLFKQLPGAIWSTDTELRITHALGRLPVEAGVDSIVGEGTTVYDITGTRDPEDPAVKSHLAALAGQRGAFRYPLFGRWFEILVEPLRDASGKVTGCIGSGIDITDRKRAEDDAQSAISLLQAAFDATADGLLVVDREGHVTENNQRFIDLWRIPAELADSRDDEARLAFVLDQLEEPESFLRCVRALYDDPKRESFDVLRFKDGRVFERYSRPQRVGDSIVGRVWSFRDVTERERLLRRAEFLADAGRLLASLDIERALEGVAHLAVPYLCDGCAIDLFATDGPRRQHVITRDPARPLTHELHPAVLTGHVALHAIDGISYMSVPITTKGEVVGAITFAAPPGRRYARADLELAEEVGRRVSLAVENATLYGRAQEALRARDEFLSIAAHEIRSPLTSIRLAVQTLRTGTCSPEATERLLGVLEREDRRLALFVDELLDLGRIRAGHFHIDFEEVDLGDLVRDVVNRMGTEITRSGSSLSLSVAPHVTGQWDRFRVEQVATNLISNAIKFGRGNPIEVEVSAFDGHARLAVRDHGIGVPAAMQEKIFQPFERAVSVRHYGGLGLGLFIVRTIVESLDGTVRVESAPGAGATFIVELPRRREPE